MESPKPRTERRPVDLEGIRRAVELAHEQLILQAFQPLAAPEQKPA